MFDKAFQVLKTTVVILFGLQLSYSLYKAVMTSIDPEGHRQHGITPKDAINSCMQGEIMLGLSDFASLISLDSSVIKKTPQGKPDISGSFTYKSTSGNIKTAAFHCAGK